MSNGRLADYYERRSPDYDAVYAKPERQDDIKRLSELIPPLLAQRDVLEVAAGTGYWTPFIAGAARSILATDFNPGPLAIAETRSYPRNNVRFSLADAFHLEDVEGEFDGAFAGFWWSHILVGDIDRWLGGLCSRLRPGSPVVIVDNRYVEGSNHAISRTDDGGNTYQTRMLADGTTHEILKNFPAMDALCALGNTYGTEVDIAELPYYWLLTFTTR